MLLLVLDLLQLVMFMQILKLDILKYTMAQHMAGSKLVQLHQRQLA